MATAWTRPQKLQLTGILVGLLAILVTAAGIFLNTVNKINVELKSTKDEVETLKAKIATIDRLTSQEAAIRTLTADNIGVYGTVTAHQFAGNGTNAGRIELYGKTPDIGWAIGVDERNLYVEQLVYGVWTNRQPLASPKH